MWAHPGILKRSIQTVLCVRGYKEKAQEMRL